MNPRRNYQTRIEEMESIEERTYQATKKSYDAVIQCLEEKIHQHEESIKQAHLILDEMGVPIGRMKDDDIDQVEQLINRLLWLLVAKTQQDRGPHHDPTTDPL